MPMPQAKGPRFREGKEWLGMLDTPLETTLSFTADYILLTLTTQTHAL